MKLSGKSVREVADLMGHKNAKAAQTTYGKKLAGHASFAPQNEESLQQKLETGLTTPKAGL